MQQPSSPDNPVLAQDLKQLRVPGKVMAALWTVRTDRCTLQVVLPNAGNGARVVAASVKNREPYSPPSIELWLLAAGGSVITPYYRWESANFKVPPLSTRAQAPELNFQFPRSAASQAVAAVLKVDGAYFIEPIHPLDK
jgi:hypothetical protein